MTQKDGETEGRGRAVGGLASWVCGRNALEEFADIWQIATLRPGVEALAEVERWEGPATPREWASGPLADHRAAVLARFASQLVNALDVSEDLAASPALLRVFRARAVAAVLLALEVCGRPRVPSKPTTPAERLGPKPKKGGGA